MKVLIGIPCLMTGGTEIQTLSLVQALVAAGHQVEVACYFEHSAQMVKRYEDAGARVRLLMPEGTRPAGIKAVVTHLWKGLRGVVKEFHPDVAHIQYMAPGALPVLILKALGVKNIVATTHTAGDIYSPNGLKIIRFLTNHVLSGFQCITERAERSYFGESRLFDGSGAKHFTIYNNIPSHISILSQPREPKSPNDEITVGVVSRLEHIKGMDLVVPAFAEAAKSNPRLRLLIVGEGSQRPLMEQQVRDFDINDKVSFAGRQPQDMLQSFYDQIDILLMPSRSEGFGLTAIEGMARGCVPVVAETGGLPEVVVPGTGLLHKPDDTSAIAHAIIQAASSDDNLSATSEAALSRSTLFSLAVYKNQIAGWYNTLN